MERPGRLRFVPLGGLGEVGLNCLAIDGGDRFVLIDCGSMFPFSDAYGIDLIVPDFDFVLRHRARFAGVAVTHGHEDHIGALGYLLREAPAPVWCPPFAFELAADRLSEAGPGLADHLVRVGPGGAVAPPGMDGARLEWIRVQHSIPHACAVALHHPAGRCLFSGDFRIDPGCDEAWWPASRDRLAGLGREGLDILFCDSTNADREGRTAPETAVAERIGGLMREAEGLVAVTLFASHLQRVLAVARAAVALGRKVAVTGRSLESSLSIGQALGLCRLPPDSLVPIEAIPTLPRRASCVIATGSQAEISSVMLRIARGEHRHVRLCPGDLAILSSRTVPGNEPQVHQLINRLWLLGVRVMAGEQHGVHTSGHARREEIADLVRLTGPDWFVPVHGEPRQIAAAAAVAVAAGMDAGQVVVARNGQPVELEGGRVRMVDSRGRFSAGRRLVDGGETAVPPSRIVRERRRLARDGVVIPQVTVDRTTGRLLAEPVIQTAGFAFSEEWAPHLEQAGREIRDLFDGEAADGRKPAELRLVIARRLKRHFARVLGSEPVIVPVVIER